MGKNYKVAALILIIIVAKENSPIMAHKQQQHTNPASPYVDLHHGHNVTHDAAEVAGAVLERQGGSPMFRIAGFNDSGGVEEERCFPSADGTVNLRDIEKKMNSSPGEGGLNGVAVAVQVKANGGRSEFQDWTFVDDIIASDESDEPEAAAV